MSSAHALHGHSENPFTLSYFKYHASLIVTYILIVLIWYCFDNLMDLFFPQKWYWYLILLIALILYFYFYHTVYLINP
jgi:hypothetical protein